MSARPFTASFAALLAGLAFTASLPGGAGAAGDGLAALRDKARPVVILSDQRDDPRIAKQKAELSGPGSAERGIAILSEDDPDGALHKKLKVGRGFAVVLVGKDGGVKNVWHAPVDSRSVFTVIDGMPMRQKEMNG